MNRLEPHTIASILLTQAPGWARVELTSRDHRLRERAAEELATAIVERLDASPTPDPRQIALPQ